MDIDITDLQGDEIQDILVNYPNGALAIKHDRIFWDSGNLEPQSPTGAAPMQPPRQPMPGYPQQQPAPQPRQQQIGERFANMADTLGSMVCAPPQPQPYPYPPRR